MIKKLAFYTLIFTFLITGLNVQATETEMETGTLLSKPELANDSITLTDSATVRMILRAQWGYVRGGGSNDTEAKVYDGSISAQHSDQARVHLIKTLKWERHDLVTGKENPVSWNSIIYNHWDGIEVAVSAKANETITVTTEQGKIAKTAREWFSQESPAVLELPNNQFLIVKSHPFKHRRLFATVWWGKEKNVEKNTATTTLSSLPPQLDFSGTITMDDNSAVHLTKALRFERAQGDKITRRGRKGIAWNSFIVGGRDGLVLRLIPNNNAPLTTSFTITFDSDDVQFSQEVNLENLYEQKIIRVEVPTSHGAEKYVLIIGQAHQTAQRVLKNKRGNYFLLQHGKKRLIQNISKLKQLHLEKTTIENVDDDEIEAFAEDEEEVAADGTLAASPKGTIYAIADGNKRRILNPRVLKKLHLDKLRVQRLSQKEIDAIPDGMVLSENDEQPSGTLIKRHGDSAVWLIEGGKRKVFTNAAIFFKRGLSFDNVIEVDDDQFNDFAWAPPLLYPDGSLIKFTDKKVYLVDNGKRRHIESEKDFIGLGFQWKDINVISDAEVFNYPEGDPVVATEQTEVETF